MCLIMSTYYREDISIKFEISHPIKQDLPSWTEEDADSSNFEMLKSPITYDSAHIQESLLRNSRNLGYETVLS